jgi:Na+-driven multidrug efflux pump
MAKKHIFSAHNDFKTGVLYKFFLVVACILFVLFFVELLLHPLGLHSDASGTILAFVILSLGLAAILYFFSRQFTKLSEIADDIEQDESLDDDEEIKDQQ